jgi:glycerol-3-phosphate dehydrogenase
MEPNLNPSALKGAVHIPGEIVLDPWLYSVALAVQARQLGADIFTNFCVASCSFDGEQWTLRSETGNDIAIQARSVVSATGLWSEELQRQVHGTCSWQAKPRRGQYIIFDRNDKTHITCPIQPVPTQRTKGIFVFSTIYNQIVVGPTALDQESRTDTTIDPNVREELAQHVKRILPNLDTEAEPAGEYVGIRPGTDKRDYQIHCTWPKRWITCAGIRSTGLTASLGIGRHVLHLLRQGILPEREPLDTSQSQSKPLPAVEELIANFHKRGDGKVEIHGYVYRVTHPLTILGWKARYPSDGTLPASKL